jgi:hypothetical protein
MALKLLAGPFEIKDADGVSAGQVYSLHMYPHRGIVVGFGGYLCVLTLDGVMGDGINTLTPAILGYWPRRNLLVYPVMDASGLVYDYSLEPRAFLETPQDGAWANDSVFYHYIRLEDRHLWHRAGYIRAILNYEETPEFDLPFGDNAHLGPGRFENEIFVGGESNDAPCCFYNHVLKQVASDVMYLGMEATWVIYDPDHKVIVSLHRGEPSYLRIWALEVQPTSISSVQLIAGALKAGHVCTYQVRVTGAQGEACAEELIDWTISGVGELIDPQSETDEDGYATVKVLYRFDDIGDSTITATLKC